ncbi:MAG: imidazole glycerol phosphate synthase subunit HisH [Pelagibacteraceae bacterium TMED65]|nr:MAG: imidazole glycerol phosphate synthase subunit HisH [Pelagibacteraceae bacterium TMED65]
MISIIDYGLGNTNAFANIYKKLNIKADIASTPKQLKEAKKIVLPGVGSFDWAMTLLNKSGMREPLEELVIEKKIPVLGVCVGMQIMAENSEEGIMEGLGWFKGTVRKFDFIKEKFALQVPHMGWNKVKPRKNHSLFKGISVEDFFYFLHSFYVLTEDKSISIAITNYGVDFSSVTQRENIYGVQFHPEKSHFSGINLLQNFAELNSC